MKVSPFLCWTPCTKKKTKSGLNCKNIFTIYRCLLPFEQSNASYFDLTLSEKNMSYPWDILAKNFSSCKMYDTNYTEQYFQNGIPATETVRCNQWVYDTHKYPSTTLIEVSKIMSTVASCIYCYIPWTDLFYILDLFLSEAWEKVNLKSQVFSVSGVAECQSLLKLGSSTWNILLANL